MKTKKEVKFTLKELEATAEFYKEIMKISYKPPAFRMIEAIIDDYIRFLHREEWSKIL